MVRAERSEFARSGDNCAQGQITYWSHWRLSCLLCINALAWNNDVHYQWSSEVQDWKLWSRLTTQRSLGLRSKRWISSMNSQLRRLWSCTHCVEKDTCKQNSTTGNGAAGPKWIPEYSCIFIGIAFAWQNGGAATLDEFSNGQTNHRSSECIRNKMKFKSY